MHRADADPATASLEWLDPDHQPERIVGRSDELTAFRGVLEDIFDSACRHCFVYGQRGVGKTLLSTTVPEQISHDEWTVRSVSGDRFESGYGLLVGVVNAFRPDGRELAPTGHARDAVIDALATELAAAAPVLLVLDDVDGVDSPDALLEFEEIADEIEVATLCVANSYSYRNELPFPVRQRLCEREVVLSPLDRTAVREALSDRSASALGEGVLSADALETCVDLVTGQFEGNLRWGIELLQIAAEQLLARDGARLTRSDVDDARTDLETRRITRSLLDAPVHRAFTFFGLVVPTLDEPAPRIGDVYESYQRVCSGADADPITVRALHDHLDSLRSDGFVSVTSHRSGTPGHYYRYHLEASPAASRRALVDLPHVDSTLVDRCVGDLHS
ncbi:DNA replication protein Orc8 [Salinarchaeum chitinilyticum]